MNHSELEIFYWFEQFFNFKLNLAQGCNPRQKKAGLFESKSEDANDDNDNDHTATAPLMKITQ